MAKEPEDRDFMEVPEDESEEEIVFDPSEYEDEVASEWDGEPSASEKLSFMEAKQKKTENGLSSLKTYFWIGMVLAVVLIWAFSQPKDHSMDRRAGETVAEHQARMDRAHEAEPEQDLSGGSHSWE